MAARNITDAFEDCINRIASGQSIEQCLRAYPQYADSLRPMLRASQAMRALRFSQSQLLEDQETVWDMIIQQGINPHVVPIRRRRPPYQLLIAAVMLFLTMAVSWFMLSRPDLPPEEDEAIIATLASITLEPEASATSTATTVLTQTPTPTKTLTVTTTFLSTPTMTLLPSPVSTTTVIASVTAVNSPTAAFVPGCGVPLTEEDAIALVLSIYPNTTITNIRQTLKYDETLVWEVQTSHDILIDIDVACGTILVIERTENDGGPNNENTNQSDNYGSGNSGSGNDNINTNDNSDDDDDSSSNDNNDDDDDNDDDDNNSGRGSNDDDDD